MKTRVGAGVVLAVLLSMQALSQVGVWKNYTSMQDVRAVARSGKVLWAASTGGMFAWTEGASSYSRFTNAEGLKSIDLTAITVDRNGDVWSGSSTGMLHVYSPQTNTWRYVPDIATANQTDKRINNLVGLGDTLLVCTNFGLSVFRLSRFQFGDTYTKFGIFTGNVRVAVNSATIFNGKIWAALSTGKSCRLSRSLEPQPASA
jgi:ligand-binding sensor domain-containing protein